MNDTPETDKKCPYCKAMPMGMVAKVRWTCGSYGGPTGRSEHCKERASAWDQRDAALRERDEARGLAKEADLGHDMAISDLKKCETELAEATTKLAEISSLTESIVEKANALIARWDQPSWKDTAPTARFINALRIAVKAYERGNK